MSQAAHPQNQASNPREPSESPVPKPAAAPGSQVASDRQGRPRDSAGESRFLESRGYQPPAAQWCSIDTNVTAKCVSDVKCPSCSKMLEHSISVRNTIPGPHLKTGFEVRQESAKLHLQAASSYTYPGCARLRKVALGLRQVAPEVREVHALILRYDMTSSNSQYDSPTIQLFCHSAVSFIIENSCTPKKNKL